MKKLSLVLGLLVSGLAINAQTDTTKIKVGEKKIEFIIKDIEMEEARIDSMEHEIDSIAAEIEKEVEVAMEGLHDELKGLHEGREEKEKAVDYEDFAFLGGIEVRTNTLMNSSNNFNTPNGYDFLETDPAKSLSLSFAIFDKYIPLYKQHVGLVTGLGFNFSSYSFVQGFDLERGDNYTVAASFDSTRTYSKNKLKTAGLKLPLLLQFATGKDADKSFHFAVGGYGSLRLGKGKVKTIFDEDGKTYKNKRKDDFNLNAIDYGLEARVGYGNKSLIASYSLGSLFNPKSDIDLFPVSAGIALTF